jgi:DNA-damage-inducible protein D
MVEPYHLAVFEQKNIRNIVHNGMIFFSVIDIIEALTDSPQPSTYWGMLKKREPQLFTICEKLKFKALDGKYRPTDCANTEGVLRIIQSVPSPKAEPFKLWLASLGKQSLDENADPELAIERARELYRAKGYDDKWIETRLKSIDIRKELTEEWQKRGVKEGSEYAFLTAEISKATFGITPTEHKDLKKLGKENLRDHMSDIELIFTMLGEASTRNIAIDDDAQGYDDNLNAAQRGGRAAGTARQAYEKNLKTKVVTPVNFLKLIEENQTSNTENTELDTPQN